MSENKDTRTATQRLDDLEKVVATFYNAINGLIAANDKIAQVVGDVPLIKEAVKLLNKRIESVITCAGSPDGITQESVNKEMVKMNVEELTAQVKAWVDSGDLSPVDSIGDNSFLVCQELSSDGALVNPRIQFPLASQSEEVRSKLKDAKVGDTVPFDGKLSVQILELYQINAKNLPEAASAAPAEPTNSDSSPAPAEVSPAPAVEEAAPASS